MQALTGVGVLAALLGCWCAVSWGLGFRWRRLAARWPAPEVPAHADAPLSGAVGWVSYQNALVAAVDEGGLTLGALPLFRVGHPPVRVPWGELRFVGATPGPRPAVKLEAGGVALRLPAYLVTVHGHTVQPGVTTGTRRRYRAAMRYLAAAMVVLALLGLWLLGRDSRAGS